MEKHASALASFAIAHPAVVEALDIRPRTKLMQRIYFVMMFVLIPPTLLNVVASWHVHGTVAEYEFLGAAAFEMLMIMFFNKLSMEVIQDEDDE